jgi:hypothetical protein
MDPAGCEALLKRPWQIAGSAAPPSMPIKWYSGAQKRLFLLKRKWAPFAPVVNNVFTPYAQIFGVNGTRSV